MFHDHGKYPINVKFKGGKNPIKKIQEARTSEIKYMSGQLCQMINDGKIIIAKRTKRIKSTKAVIKKQANTSIKICTPFTSKNEAGVTVIRDFQNKYLFVCSLGRIPTAYAKLNKILNAKKKHTYKKDQLETIYEYLCMPPSNKITDIETFNNLVKTQYLYKNLDELKENDNQLRHVLNVLSAILMIAEPYRFDDQGRQSRALIRRMYSNFNRTEGTLTKSRIAKKKAQKEIINMINTDYDDHTLDIDDEYLSSDEFENEKIKEEEEDSMSTEENESDFEELHKISKEEKEKSKPKKEIKAKKTIKKTTKK